MLKWLFFDLGSTLLNESESVRLRIETTALQNGLDPAAFEAMLAEAARKHPYALQMELPGGIAWEPWPKRPDPLYPGVPEMLAALRGTYKLGIIANQSPGTQDRLRAWGIAQYFDVIASSAEKGCKKPDPRIFTLALEQAGCLPGEAAMIGDRLDNDIAPAKKLGMRTIWVRQGWGGAPEPTGEADTPDAAVRDVLKVPEALERLR